MLVSEAMGGTVDTCAADATMAEAAEQMTNADHGALPVIWHGCLVGMITERDILKAVARGSNPEETMVNELMTPYPDFVEPDLSVEDAANWMLAAGYRHLPIIDDGKILGILSMKDVMWALTGGTEGTRARSGNGSRS